MNDIKLIKVCKDVDFKELLIKLYEYCEEINIIEERMDVLAKETEKMYFSHNNLEKDSSLNCWIHKLQKSNKKQSK